MAKMTLIPTGPVYDWSGPGWVGHAHTYEHELWGQIVVPTIYEEGLADVILMEHHFRIERAKNRSLRVRKAWAERCRRRQERSGEAPAEPRGGGEPKGPGKRPPAAPRGGGEAA